MRRPKKTVTINLSDYLSAGTYNVKVKSKGTDIRDSEESNSVECVVGSSGYEVTFTASGGWINEESGYIAIYDGQDNTGTLLLEQRPANKSTFPTTVNVSSGYCYIYLSGLMILGSITSTYYTISDGDISDVVDFGLYVEVNKNGTINIYVSNWDD